MNNGARALPAATATATPRTVLDGPGRGRPSGKSKPASKGQPHRAPSSRLVAIMLSGSELLRCETPGLWVREGELRTDQFPRS